MRALSGAAFACCSLFVSSCSMTPTLEESAGSTEPRVFVKDVVQRVKCEIHDTAKSLEKKNKLRWTRDWQAKVNLQLQVSNVAGLTPSVTVTKYFHNAINRDAGPSTFPATAARSVVSQLFTFGAGVTYQEQAQRLDVVNFTVAFGDITSDNSTEQPKGCEVTGSELQGGLGLQEWVDSAFYPVETSQLLAGNAAKPKIDDAAFEQKECAFDAHFCSNYSGFSAKSIKFKWEAAKIFKDQCVDKEFFRNEFLDKEGNITPHAVQARHIIDDIESEANRLHELPIHQCRTVANLVVQYNLKQRIETAYKNVMLGGEDKQGAHVDGYVVQARNYYKKKIEPFEEVLNNKKASADMKSAYDQIIKIENFFKISHPLREYITSYLGTLSLYTANVNENGDSQKNIKSDQKQNEKIDLKKKSDTEPVQLPSSMSEYKLLIQASAYVLFLEALAQNAQDLNSYIQGFTPSKPIDSVSHTVQFILTYGGNISPNWTLIQMKGGGSPLASAQGVRTHQMIISIGPKDENTQNIQNATVTSAIARQ